MADGEVSILIRAQDEATATLKRIEGSVNDLGKKSETANKSLAESFSKVQGAMLNLGQVAQSVHNIFEIYQNKTRALENAQDRLENANIRLKQSFYDVGTAQKKLQAINESHARDGITLERAQLRLEEATREYNITLSRYGKDSLAAKNAALDLEEAQLDLNDAQKLGKKKAIELAEANQELKDKQDAVIIATNGVERAQRNVDRTLENARWMYVDMGMQALSTAGNIGVFARSMGMIGPATAGASGAITGISGAMGGLGAAVGMGGLAATLGVSGALAGLLALMLAFPVKTPEWKKAIDEQILKLEELRLKVDETGKAFIDLLIQEQKLKEFQISQGAGQFGGKTTSQQFVPKGLEVQEGVFDLDKFDVFTGKSGWDKLWEGFNEGPPKLESNLGKMSESYNSFATNVQVQNEHMLGSEKKSTPLIWLMKQAEMEWITMANIASVQISSIINQLNQIPLKITTVHETLEITSKGTSSGITGSRSTVGYDKLGQPMSKMNDFIMRPGQEAISFSKDDTIVGMKDIGSMGKGMTIIIEGNIYGTDPDEMAEALVNKLRKKIALQ